MGPSLRTVPCLAKGSRMQSASAACKACRARPRRASRCAPTSTATEQHAAVRVEAHDRRRLEQLCRYITRPALSDERVQVNAAGQVELKRETAWRDGPAGRARPVAGPFARHKQSTGLFVSGLSTTHLVMSPMEFMQRMAALVPRPRLHFIRFHGVLAPNAKLRALVVPQGPEVEEQATEAVAASECVVETATTPGRPHRVGWARLLERVLAAT